MDEPSEVWLCLSGGNALGAYHAGAYAGLHRAGIHPARIAGTSVGAIVAAIIAGNKWEDRIARLDEFWSLASRDLAMVNYAQESDGAKIASALGTLIQGRPGLFQPSIVAWWRRLIGLSAPSLFERSGLREKLTQLIDFELLNSGEVRLITNAVDVATGQEHIYDSAEMRITVDHLMASSAFPVLYSPEPIEGLHMVDGGLAANLPLLPLFRDPPKGRVKCLAFDLVSPIGNIPESLDDAIRRMQDLLLSAQSTRSIELLGLQAQHGSQEVLLLHVTYDGRQEVGGKMLEFSSPSMKTRKHAGEADAAIALAWLRHGSAASDIPVNMKSYSSAGGTTRVTAAGKHQTPPKLTPHESGA